MAEENNPTIIGLTQQLLPEFWTWAVNDPAAAAILRRNAAEIVAYLVQRLEAAGCEIIAAYAVVHDKDERDVWSDANSAFVRELKPIHIHAVIKFKNRAKSAAISLLAHRLGVDAQYVEKPGRGSHALDNMLSYLTHAKYVDKHQYDPAEVATARGPEYATIDRERRDAWIKGRAHIVKKRAVEGLEHLRQMVLTGQVTKQQIMLTDDLYEIYALHSREIDEAISVSGQRRAYQAAAKLRAGAFSTNVIFAYGASGVGKTAFVKRMIDCVIQYAAFRGQSWQVYRAATGNPLDDWQGEEIILLDDLRASAMDANDWLLLLDPYNASPARARYKNKGEVAPRVIIITATIEPVRFFFYARKKGEVDEALDQFIRRLASIVRVFQVGDEVRYQVQRTGRLEPYDHILENIDPTLPSNSNINRKILRLAFGPKDEVEHSDDGAVSALMIGLAMSSSDVGFESAREWPGLEMVAQSEELEARQLQELAS